MNEGNRECPTGVTSRNEADQLYELRVKWERAEAAAKQAQEQYEEDVKMLPTYTTFHRLAMAAQKAWQDYHRHKIFPPSDSGDKT